MQDFLLNIKSKLDSISNPVEAQLFLENFWTEKMKEFYSLISIKFIIITNRKFIIFHISC